MYFKIVYPGCPNVHNIKSAQLGSEILGIPGKVKKKITLHLKPVSVLSWIVIMQKYLEYKKK